MHQLLRRPARPGRRRPWARRALVLSTGFASVLAAAACAGGSPAATGAAPPSVASTGATSGGTGGSTPSGSSTAATDRADLPDGYAGHRSEIYADGQHWLCHPDVVDDVCERNMDATVLGPGGLGAVEPHVPAADPGVDCFYIYPTISGDPDLNSDLEPAEDQEVRATVNQVARLNTVCEVYAPVYRQLTVGSLLQRMGGTDVDQAAMEQAGEVAYRDVVDAWKHYMANHNDGRGVILVGHSQGASWLEQLVAEEIDDEPLLRERLVAAYLLGTTVAVPAGSDVGGSFENVPLCRRADQVRCVVTYASFAASLPPGEDSLFGRVRSEAGASSGSAPALAAGCTNPAALTGGPGALRSYFRGPEAERLLAAGGITETIDTDWLLLQGSLSGECIDADGFSYLRVTLNGDPSDVRDRQFAGGLPPASWGLHLADANLAMGNLVEMAATQAEAFAR